MRVLVLDNQKQPLMPCRQARARQLLRDGKAAVFRRYPFTIILKERQGGDTQPVSLSVDPGSKTTGIALVALFQRGRVAIYGQHIVHRGQQIRDALESRRAIRRSRRNRKTRYRQPRFLNRTRPKGWLPPSLTSRVHNLETWAKRLIGSAPVTSANVETVRFDMQLIENPSIAGKEYQQGSLFGWELREYLLYRHQHICAYCHGLTRDAVLEKEHIIPKALGGSNRLANHVLSCRECNEDKGKLHPNAWVTLCEQRADKVNLMRSKNMTRIMTGYRPSLKDAAAVNATRYAIGNRIKSIISDTHFWSGGLTKKNRSEQRYLKDHWIDAACVGQNGGAVSLECNYIIVASAKGHGSRQMCRVDKYGFPRTSAKSHSIVHGFRTGDLVVANVPNGKKQGLHVGRVAVRKNGYFNVQTKNGAVQGIFYKNCRITQHSDGYNFNYGAAIPPTTHSKIRVAVSLPNF
ncbi:RNA-guided endonuclease IscB [Alteromonas gilva]|uniref:RNA-guided endonuclease IscB n=1 Tax=Alteromonas gilva TaxID=2987522 RepID=A0ABT5L7D9_9ALTE|nr:RNA-guided endonuclease IscB [Alteromonas gilva]MDC8832965.1 RNA-guided endonuclease IscB [Alteromonas gilva]